MARMPEEGYHARGRMDSQFPLDDVAGAARAGAGRVGREAVDSQFLLDAPDRPDVYPTDGSRAASVARLAVRPPARPIALPRQAPAGRDATGMRDVRRSYAWPQASARAAARAASELDDAGYAGDTGYAGYAGVSPGTPLAPRSEAFGGSYVRASSVRASSVRASSVRASSRSSGTSHAGSYAPPFAPRATAWARPGARPIRSANLTGSIRLRRGALGRTGRALGPLLALVLVTAVGAAAFMLLKTGALAGIGGSAQARANPEPLLDTPAPDAAATATASAPSATATATLPPAPTRAPTPRVGATATPLPTRTPAPPPTATAGAAATPRSTPSPSTAAAPNPAHVGATFNTAGQPCHSLSFFGQTISAWAIPPGCYATVYTPNPKDYPRVPSAFGWCNWWVQELHPNNHDILDNLKYRRGATPVPGAAIYFHPNEQGASSAGHFAQVVAIAPGGQWILVTEMNFTWRGAGFGKIDYRYVRVTSGMEFIYTN